MQITPISSIPRGIRGLPNPPPLIQDNQAPQADQLSQLLSRSTAEGNSNVGPLTPTPIGQGIPLTHKRIANRIAAVDYIDFMDLPPAKGKVKQIPATEGNIIVVQAADLMQQKKLIPNIVTWTQCFTIYMAVVTKQSSERAADLLIKIKWANLDPSLFALFRIGFHTYCTTESFPNVTSCWLRTHSYHCSYYREVGTWLHWVLDVHFISKNQLA